MCSEDDLKQLQAKHPYTTTEPAYHGWERKLWGWARYTVETPKFIACYCQGQLGGFCSKHFHQNMDNYFDVHSGAIMVTTWHGRDGEAASRLVDAGEVMMVPAKVIHQFEVVADCTMSEYYTPLSGAIISRSDILRLDNGGMHRLDEAHEPCEWLEMRRKARENAGN